MFLCVEQDVNLACNHVQVLKITKLHRKMGKNTEKGGNGKEWVKLLFNPLVPDAH